MRLITGSHVCSRHSIALPLAADAALAFFTPRGEERWVPHWRPCYLHPPGGETCAGMVFSTGEGAEFTLWTLVVYDPAAWHCRYSRVTPASRAGIVDVQLTPDGDDRCVAVVGYEMTALSPGAEPALEPYREPAFSRMLEGWRDAILAVR